MKFNESIDKRKLWRYVNKKIGRTIHHYHVLSVISILFDEIVKDLKSERKIKIYNFGTLLSKSMKPRKYFNVRHQKVMESRGSRILRFILAPTLRKKIINKLDLDKTLKDD